MTMSKQTVEQALKVAHQQYIEKNPKSQQQNIKASKVLPGGNTRSVLYSDPFPITLASADDCYVTSLDGDVYLDYVGEYTAGLFGHSNPTIKQALHEALESGWVRGGHIPQEEVLASLICSRFTTIEQVRFTNSGTEANLVALQTARYITGKTKVVVFEGGYHGGVLVFGAKPSPINIPFEYIVAPYNDWLGTLNLLNQHKDEIACVIIEGHQGAGGCIPSDPEFLHNIDQWTKENNAFFILDEVMTSRFSGGGIQELLGLKPDITTLGKYIGGGLSFGAFGGRADVMEIYNPNNPNSIGHAGTFNNNVFTMTAGAAAYGKVFTPEVASKLTQKGNELRERLNKVAQKAHFPMQFTGFGSLMNVHMCAGDIRSIRDLKKEHSALKDLFYFDLISQGIWPARRGMLVLSLPMGDEAFNQLVTAVEHFVEHRKDLIL